MQPHMTDLDLVCELVADVAASRKVILLFRVGAEASFTLLKFGNFLRSHPSIQAIATPTRLERWVGGWGASI